MKSTKPFILVVFVLHDGTGDCRSVRSVKRKKRLSLGHESRLEIFNKRAQTNHIPQEVQLLHISNLFTASGSCTVFTLIVKLVKYSFASDSRAHTAGVYARIYVHPPRAFIIFKVHWRRRFHPSSRPDGWPTLNGDFPSLRTPVASARRGPAPRQRTLSYSAREGAAPLDAARHKYLMRALSRRCIKDAAPCLTRSQLQLKEQFTQR